jgi:catechol 2,3-dioxygenase-like lactoylglutathione lyase family enzyme
MRWLLLLPVSAAFLFAQLSAPNDSGVSMGHVHLYVSDPEAQKKLWVDLLGAQVTHSGTLELLKFPGILVVVAKARTATTGGSDGSTVNHFGFLVKSYADTKAKLTAANVTFTMDRPKDKQMIAQFPDGVRVEFTEDTNLKVPIAFHHIHEVATDPENVRAWYVKTLGAKAGKRGEFMAAMVPGGEVDFRKADTAAAATKGRSLDHIGFEVTNLEAFCKKLETDGVTFDTPYRVVPQLDGLKIAYILDPIGTRIELTEGFASK